MNAAHWLPLLAVVAIGSYFQAITGFGLGMIVMGVCSGLGLVPLPLAANIVSLVTLASCALALRGTWHDIDWSATAATISGILPAILAGVVLLDYLNHAAALLLQVLLGLAITTSGITFTLRPQPLERRSGKGSFFVSGLLSGLFGGLFGMAGPPIIFHVYRQPITLTAARSMLLLVFAFTAAARTLFVVSRGLPSGAELLLTGYAILLACLATQLARRYPPPLAGLRLRQLAFSTLLLIGSCLLLGALHGLFA
ncbi:TSUP family transporter [Aquitalea sp. ASV15]|uniref:TSUP family transporter n=1 Tax=Aquitalea sp. ASV15 TaxID=2795104 RepID=UPI0018EAABD3|nr:TSUP family transporter [Aquitalea sp. ASV15]